MIDNREAIRLVLEACAGIGPYWEKHLDFWEGDEPGAYNEIAVVAHYVVERCGQGQRDDFDSIFLIVERIIVDGSKSARGLVVVGFLESVLTVSSHGPLGSSIFEQWFGPATAQAWKELHELWQGKASLADVIRSQRKRNE